LDSILSKLRAEKAINEKNATILYRKIKSEKQKRIAEIRQKNLQKKKKIEEARKHNLQLLQEQKQRIEEIRKHNLKLVKEGKVNSHHTKKKPLFEKQNDGFDNLREINPMINIRVRK